MMYRRSLSGLAEHCCGCRVLAAGNLPRNGLNTLKQAQRLARHSSQERPFSTLDKKTRNYLSNSDTLNNLNCRNLPLLNSVISNYKPPKTVNWHSGTNVCRTFEKLLPSSSTVHLQKCDIHNNMRGENRQPRRHFILSPQGIVEASPIYIQPYLRLMRLDRPIGTWLLFLPCTWSISLAAPPGAFPDPYMLGLFALGSFLMRGAGCTVNDLWDKDYDRRVERTKDRPLACGQITNLQALTFLGLQLSGSLGILLTLNWNTIILGACSMLPVVIYPLMKRVTYWPQAFLGLTLNWGVMIAWSAIHGSLELPGFLLYLSCVLWTMNYDTIYSHQDKDDDILIGVKSTALKFGDETKMWLSGFSGLMVSGLTVTGYLCEQTWPYYTGVAMVAAHLGQQIYTVDLNNSDECGKKFRSNKYLGLVFWAMIVASNMLKSDGQAEKKNVRGQTS